MSSNKSANSSFISEEEAKKAKTTKNAKPAKKKSDKPT